MIKIRLARGGRVHRPVFTIVAADERFPRDGKFLEKLGQYDPQDKEVLKYMKPEAISEWVKKGAQLTDSVRSLLKKHKINIKM